MKNPGQQVIVGFTEGSTDAFQLIYKRYHRTLYHFVKQLTDDTFEAEDIVAETFVKLWNLRSKFETEVNIKAFLYITARNASLNFLRYRSRQQENRKELYYLHKEEGFSENEIPLELQLLGLIQNTLDELPNRQQQIMRMILFEGLNDQEIAHRLNKNLRTVQNLKNIAVNYLRVNVDKKELSATVLIFYIMTQYLD